MHNDLLILPVLNAANNRYRVVIRNRSIAGNGVDKQNLVCWVYETPKPTMKMGASLE